MAETSDVQALEKISTEVGEAQIKITLSSQCIKAQAFLVDKLRKQSERQKEICSFINSNNLKLQTEIKQAEIEIKSLTVATEVIKSSNVELNKEYLLLKERKSEVDERVKDGEKKYEDLWLQAKARYESIPYVQKLLQAQEKTESLKQNIRILNEESDNLIKEVEMKKKLIADSDKKSIIELAQYLARDLPKGIKTIQEKTKAMKEVSKNIDDLMKEHEKEVNKAAAITPIPEIKEKLETESEKRKHAIEDEWFNFSRDNQPDSIMMPHIQLIQSDFDTLSAKLDKIKIKKIDMFNIAPVKRIDPIEPETDIEYKKPRKVDEFSLFYNKTINEETRNNVETKKESYSKRKLINILEDIKLDENDAYKIVSKVNPDKLKGVEKIGADEAANEKASSNTDDKIEQANDDIELIDLTKRSENLIVPPTQFLDYEEANYFGGSQQQVEVIVHMSMSDSSGKGSQNLRNSQETKKKVCFDVPMSIQEINEDIENDGQLFTQSGGNATATKESNANDTLECNADISLVSDESYTKMKDMILKKHNLDLSPNFVYAKNNALQMGNSSDDRIITSKFFEPTKTHTIAKNDDLPEVTEKSQKCESEVIIQNISDECPNMEVDDIVVSSPKPNTTQRAERSVTGLLFNHGAQGIPDSLNVSISTTGFEEGDSDFPHCIDSSLLLSPKADFPVPNSGDNAEILSQEVPNFLSGLRKTGFSFFGQSTTSDPKASTSEQNQSNFNFNFGGDEKKGRGGLFSMFR